MIYMQPQTGWSIIIYGSQTRWEKGGSVVISITTLLLEFCVKGLLKDILSSSAIEFLDIVLICLFYLVFVLEISKSKKLKELSMPLAVGFLFRIFLLFWDIYGVNIFPLPNSGDDSIWYYYNSVKFSVYGECGMGLFPKVIGTFYKFIGTSRLYGQFLIVLFSVVSLLILALLLNEIKMPRKNKSIVLYIVALLPNFAIVSSVFLRESIIAMFLTISLWLFYNWLNGESITFFVLSLAAVLTASAFHSGSVAVAFGYVTVLLLFDRETKTFKFKAKNLVPVIFIMLIFAFLYTNYSEELFGKMKNVENLSDVGNDSGRGDSSYAQYVGNSNNPINMIIFTIPRIFFFIASPLPIQWRGIKDIIAFCFSSLYFICTAGFTVKYFRMGKQTNRTLVTALSIVLICTFFVFGWGVQNAGTACRHRDKVTIICGLLLALTIPAPKNMNEGEKNEG